VSFCFRVQSGGHTRETSGAAWHSAEAPVHSYCSAGDGYPQSRCPLRAGSPGSEQAGTISLLMAEQSPAHRKVESGGMFFLLLLLVGALLVLLVVLHTLLYVVFPHKQLPVFPALPRPLLFAHQGGELLAPTNTMAAFDRADEIGECDFFDVDVHLTKDEILVGIHDETVDRTTSGHGRVDAYTLHELQELDAGYFFQDLQGHFSYREKGVKILAVEELLRKYGNKYYIHFEIKDTYPKGGPSRIEEKLWQLIQHYHLEQRVIVASFQQDIVDRFNQLACGQVVMGAGRAEIRQFVLAHKFFLPGFYRRKSQVLEIPTRGAGFNLKDRRLIAGAHRLGMEVYYWTIDDPAEMKELIELGADGLFTNRPDLLKAVLHEIGAR
jgi:glycerophosphoryl diester phosphodiesterase